MVEIDSSAAKGSCTAVAEVARARLIAAGYDPRTTELIAPPAAPQDGNLVAELAGSDPHAAPILLLAHIDVVPASAADWGGQDPFKIVEKDGYFHARGAIDDKAMASILVDTLVRLREEGFRPRRGIKLALTCGEEAGSREKGIRFLIAHRPETVKAAFVINEGASGYLDANGRALAFGVEAGQKAYQDFKLTLTGPGAHSSRPTPDNVMTRMALAVARIGQYDFPADISPVTRNFFAQTAAMRTGPIAADLRTVGGGSDDPAAIARLSAADTTWNAMIRTTCVATTMIAGHSKAALAQRAEVNVNCRILPGESVDRTRQTLLGAIADPTIVVTYNSPVLTPAPAPPLTPEILGPIQAIEREMWPGVPVIPAIALGASDGRFLDSAGIPTYGVTGMFTDPDGDGVHGLDERVRIKSLLDSRIFLYRLIRAYGSQSGKRAAKPL